MFKSYDSRESWLQHAEKLSKAFKKYKSFLPEQKELLSRIYDKMSVEEKKVWVFAAPPSSGKTHVICLVARVLAEFGEKTAVVVPSNYLKEEFVSAANDIEGGLLETDILNLAEYLRSTTPYDFVLVDEAHNLKSFLELDNEYVKSVTFKIDDFVDMIGRYLPPHRQFIARQLSYVSAKELLDTLSTVKKFRFKLKQVLSNPTSWSCFLYAWTNKGSCSVVFVENNGLCKLKMPRKHILLFSATQLSKAELLFYCGVESSDISSLEIIDSTSNLLARQKFCISIIDRLSFKEKIHFLKAVIDESNVRTLVLFNNSSTCKAAFEAIRKKTKSRIFLEQSYSLDKGKNYQDYLGCPNGMLFTSSTVFWEGITINGLRLLVIFDLPFPRPRLFDLVTKTKISSELDMSRRLRQGIGRVGRRKGEIGLSIVLSSVHVDKEDSRKILSDVTFSFAHTYQAAIVLHKIFVDNKSPTDFFGEAKHFP